jgi:molybdate/tungstate transport system permease protein
MRQVALAGWSVIVLALLVLPLITLIDHLSSGPGPFFGGALITTLVSGGLAMGFILIFGTPLSWWMARSLPPRVQGLFIILVLIPIFMPPIVLGLVLAYWLGPVDSIGHFLTGIGIEPINSLFALVSAQIYEALPYFVLTLYTALAGLSTRLEKNLTALGHTPWSAFWYASAPSLAPGLIAAMAMAWARATGAFGAAMVVAYQPTGLPIAVWKSLEEFGLPSALALAFWLVAIGLPLPLWLEGRHLFHAHD